MSELKLDQEAQKPILQLDEKGKIVVVGSAIATAGAVTLIASEPAEAAGVEDVSAMVTSLGTLAAAALAVALVPVGIFFAIRIVKRVMNA